MLFKKSEARLGKLFPAGEIIVQEGDSITHLHIMQSGVAEVYRTGFDGNRIHLALLKAGDMFGTMSLFDKQPNHSTVQVLQDAWVLLIDKKTIMRRIYEEPSLVLRIMENLSARVRRQSQEIVDLTNHYHAATGGLASIAQAILAQERGSASQGVAELVSRLCNQLSLQNCFPEALHDTFQTNMKIASYFYDIGNAGLPSEMLTQKGALGEAEKALLQTHIHIGSSVLRKTAERTQDNSHLLLAAELAQYHHEKFDGSGYLGLKSTHIPLSARIIAIVDVYTALLAERSYRQAMSQSQALHFIQERSGTHFDPQITEAFLRCL